VSAETISPAVAALEAARAAGVMIATVESCTGGLVAAALTDIAGSSDVVFGGFVTYANEAKVALGVPEALLAARGAVSEPVARAMAEAGARRAADALQAPTAAVAITGVAGPGGSSAEKPVGLIHFAVAVTGRQTVHERAEFGDPGRATVRAKSVDHALIMLAKALADRPPA